MDDPLFLLMQGIWLLAAGMYPLGFLFGACSACCDECGECPECTHICNTNVLRKISFNGTVGNFSFDQSDFGLVDWDVGACELYSFKLVEGINATERGPGPSLADVVGNAPECFGDLNNYDLVIYYGPALSVSDECGCPACSINFKAQVVRGRVAGGGAAEVNRGITIGNCSQPTSLPTSFTMTDWDPEPNNPVDENWGVGDCGTEDLFAFVKEWLDENLTIEITDIQVGECECNKCSHAYNDYESDVACSVQGSTLNYAIEGFGANTGVDTEIVIPPENLPQDVLPCFPEFPGVGCDEWFSLNIYSEEFLAGPQGGECGCLGDCLLCLTFRTTFKIDGDAAIVFLGGCCGTLADCDQTEVEFNCETIEWVLSDVVYSVDDPTLCEQCGPERLQLILDACVEYLQSLNISVSVTDITPCECGACCRDGDCEDSVVQSYCENESPGGEWAGVGTSCCDDPCEE
jgi:hypothetical protein